MSFLDELGQDWVDEAGVEPEAEAQKPAEETPEQVESQPEPEAETTEEVQPEEPEAEKPKEPFDPVAHRKMMDERRKRQEAEAELIELRREKAQREQQQPPQERQRVPDAYEKPEEFESYLEAEAFKTRAEISGLRAEMAYTKPVVEAAVQWAQSSQDPFFGQKVRGHADPVGYVVQEYQRSLTLDKLAGRSFEDAARDHAVSMGWIVSPEGAAPSPQPKPSSPIPPRSLAGKPGSGGVGTVANNDGFGDVFSSSGMGLKRG